MTEVYPVDTSFNFVSRSFASLRDMWASELDRDKDRLPSFQATIDKRTMSAVSKDLLEGLKFRFPDMDHDTIVRVVQKASDYFRDANTENNTPTPSDTSESTAPDPVSPILSDNCPPHPSRGNFTCRII